MCLITKQNKPIILKEDLIVYKLVRKWNSNKHYYSLNENFPYTFNELYKTTIEESTTWVFNDLISQKYYNYLIIKERFFCFGQGFHFYLTRKRAGLYQYGDSKGSYRHIMVKCLIPKGSKVIYDETGLGVSDQIIILGVTRKSRSKNLS